MGGHSEYTAEVNQLNERHLHLGHQWANASNEAQHEMAVARDIIRRLEGAGQARLQSSERSFEAHERNALLRSERHAQEALQQLEGPGLGR